MKLVIYII